MTKRITATLAGAALLAATAALADNGHRTAGPQHVLLISVDGMHEVDLWLWIQNHRGGALAKLARRGTVYRNAYTTAPSDSFPGMIAQVTGATPKSTGVFYDDSYDRSLFAPGSNCSGNPGTEAAFAENLDKSLADITGGGTLGDPLSQIDTTKLPQQLVNGVCTPVLPHEFIRVNTLFEVLHAHRLPTAWSDKHPGYEILNGPSGKGIDDLYTPEINSQAPTLPAGKDYTTGFQAIRDYDSLKVTAVLNEIDGWNSTHTVYNNVAPTIFGMNFQAVSVGQKLATSADPAEAGLRGGYLDANATPGPALAGELQFIDDSVGKMYAELKKQGLYDDTVVIISAKHGQSPIDPALFRKVADNYATVLADAGYAFNIADDASLIWLDPKLQKADYRKALAALRAAKTELAINYILAREELAEIYRDPFHDSRTPDFYVEPVHGVVYTGGNSKIAEHGGLADDDRHVGLLVSAAGLSGNTVSHTVFTTQIAPTILSALRFSPYELQGVRLEGTTVLPGLSGRGDEDDRDHNR